MSDSGASEGSEKLKSLAQQLRLYTTTQIRAKNGNLSAETDFKYSTNSQSAVAATTTPGPRKRAAVLVCLFEGVDGELRVILTKRSSKLSSHSGEVSLPGGKQEEGDATDVETALREAKEEIGLDPSLVDVVAVLDPIVDRRGLVVVAVIGILTNKKAFNPTPNAGEVEAIFDAPLEMFLKDENRKDEEREWMGDKFLLHYFDYEAENKKYVIWALTAGFLIRVASIVFQRPPAFSERRPKYWDRMTDN
jgi:coenzyme A diphosphatase NUDT7